jgi:hypothetical protein
MRPDTRKAQQNAETNGRDDDIDDNAVIEEHPMCLEVLQAASIINRYLDGFHNPVRQKMLLVPLLTKYAEMNHSHLFQLVLLIAFPTNSLDQSR